LAKPLIKQNFSFVDKQNVIYRGKYDPFNITLPSKNKGSCFCECCIFMKKAVCKHLVGLSNLYALNLFGESWSNKAKVFGFHKKRGRERKTNRYGEIKHKSCVLINIYFFKTDNLFYKHKDF
jgi:hypothetical protein